MAPTRPKLTSSTTYPLSPARRHSEPPAAASVSDGLAVCLGLKMFDMEYEEDIRRQAVMSEVLPDAKMWAKWEKTEAPLRQGRGWFPALDRHFLELLVVSEIHGLSHPLSLAPSPQTERIQRHAARVRRVACERIGPERLHAYCERVKEAFEAYVAGSWGAVEYACEGEEGDGRDWLSEGMEGVKVELEEVTEKVDDEGSSEGSCDLNGDDSEMSAPDDRILKGDAQERPPRPRGMEAGEVSV